MVNALAFYKTVTKKRKPVVDLRKETLKSILAKSLTSEAPSEGAKIRTFSKAGSIDVEMKDLTTRYANDVIASCAFGLKVDSHMDVDNQFYAMGKATSTFNFKRVMIFFGFSSFPNIMKLLKFSIFTEAMKDFFRQLVMGTMHDREMKHIIRPDMIHLLMEAKKVWSDDDLTAQAILFFIAGFDTIATGMSFLLYELALHPGIQNKLVEEIRENYRKNGENFNYNSILSMTYLDMVVSETLRLWPPAINLDRLCIKDYNCGKPNSKSKKDYILRKGTGLHIPVWAIHRNPDYFPDPLKFDPERFSEENKHKIKPFTYMPFGLGPRNCIGSRFALCEMKVMVYQLLQHMEVSPCERTCIPAQLETGNFNIKLKGGHWAKFNIRKD